MDVGGWLRSLGLGQYEANFRENKIDVDVLPQLTADDLKDIGVSAVGDRRRLLAAIAALSGPTPSTNAPASSSKQAPGKGLEISAERRPIAVMFCDLVGSTSLAARLDAEDWRNLVGAYLDEASAAVTGFGGHVLKKLGDGLMALFGYPQAEENDAGRAVRAALAIRSRRARIEADHWAGSWRRKRRAKAAQTKPGRSTYASTRPWSKSRSKCVRTHLAVDVASFADRGVRALTWVKWAQENGQLPIRRDPPKPGLSNGSSVEVGHGPDKSCYRRTSSCPLRSPRSIGLSPSMRPPIPVASSRQTGISRLDWRGCRRRGFGPQALFGQPSRTAAA